MLIDAIVMLGVCLWCARQNDYSLTARSRVLLLCYPLWSLLELQEARPILNQEFTNKVTNRYGEIGGVPGHCNEIYMWISDIAPPATSRYTSRPRDSEHTRKTTTWELETTSKWILYLSPAKKVIKE
jgi:hypothetical protein